MTRLLNRLWADNCGAVLTLEYLTLGSVVAMGSAAGLASMKDAMVDECKEFGRAVHETKPAANPIKVRPETLHKCGVYDRHQRRSRFVGRGEGSSRQQPDTEGFQE